MCFNGRVVLFHFISPTNYLNYWRLLYTPISPHRGFSTPANATYNLSWTLLRDSSVWLSAHQCGRFAPTRRHSCYIWLCTNPQMYTFCVHTNLHRYGLTFFTMLLVRSYLLAQLNNFAFVSHDRRDARNAKAIEDELADQTSRLLVHRTCQIHNRVLWSRILRWYQ